MAVGHHFHPFFVAIGTELQSSSSVKVRMFSLFIKLLSVAMALAVLMLASRIFQMVIGNEIVQEEEIVILEQVTRSRAEKEGIVEGEEVLSAEAAINQLATLENEQQPKENKTKRRRDKKERKKNQ